jgi:hypothetical protein
MPCSASTEATASARRLAELGKVDTAVTIGVTTLKARPLEQLAAGQHAVPIGIQLGEALLQGCLAQAPALGGVGLEFAAIEQAVAVGIDQRKLLGKPWSQRRLCAAEALIAIGVEALQPGAAGALRRDARCGAQQGEGDNKASRAVHGAGSFGLVTVINGPACTRLTPQLTLLRG